MCAPAIAGVASFASGALGAVGQHQSAQAQANAQNAYSRRQYKYQIAQREADWGNQLSIWGNKKADYNNEISANYDAANRAYASEQYRLNEQFQQAAFQKQDMLAQLIQSQGGLAASEKTGRTAQRLDTAALGAFGRNNAIIAENLASARTAMINKNEDTRLQLQGANNRAWSQVAVAPVPGLAPMQPQMVAGPSGLGLAAGLIGAGLSGFSTYNSLKAPAGWTGQQGGGGSGFKLNNTYKLPSGPGYAQGFSINNQFGY